jgi:uncharacterized small protein (DUF1192 family)
MPITQELQTIQDLRGAGFTEPQALLLASKFEATAQATSQDLKSFIIVEMDKRFAALTAEMDRRFSLVDQRFAEQKAEFERSLRIQLVAILSAFVGVTGLAVAIIKLIP